MYNSISPMNKQKLRGAGVDRNPGDQAGVGRGASVRRPL